jgi:chromate transporter
LRGIPGALLSFLAYNLPAFMLMLGLTYLYERVHELPKAVSIFAGLQAVIMAIILHAVWTFARSFLKTPRQFSIAFVALIWSILGVHPILVLIFSVALGLFWYRGQPFKAAEGRPAKPSYGYKTILILLLVLAGGFAAIFLLDRKMFELAFAMFRVDLFAFGGGYAAIPLMFHEVVTRYQWLDAKTLMSGVALGQVTPGPIIITATFIGYLTKGIAGALVATISIYAPSLLILIAAVPYFDRLQNNPYFNRATGGVLCAFVGLLTWLAYSFGAKVPWDPALAIMAGAALLALLLKVETVWVVLVGISVSFLWS